MAHSITDTGSINQTGTSFTWRRRPVLIALGVLLAAALLAVAYFVFLRPAQTTASPEQLQTSVVRQGDIVLSASGSGTLIAGNTQQLGFGVSGTVEQLDVQAGDQVVVDQVLAVQADSDQLDAAVAAAKLDLLQAQQDLQSLYDNADQVTAQAKLDLADAQQAYDDAQSSWQSQQEGYRASSTTIKAAEAELTLAEDAMANAKHAYDSCGSSDDPQCAQLYKNYAAAQQRYWRALANVNWYKGHPTDTQESQLDAELALAQAQLAAAQRAYDKVADGPDPDQVALAEVKVSNAQAALSVAQQNKDKSVITAPFDGTVMSVSASAGDTASGAFITVADLSVPELQFYVDETDADKVAVGYPVDVVFDAQPDTTYTGTVVQLDPSLSTSGGFATIRGRVQLDSGPIEGLLVGMNASVEVVAAKAEGVPLVPVEALRELSPGEYAVFVMQDGEPRLRPVEVGLQDFNFAQIISGVDVGETVTTGVVQTGG